MYLSVAIHYLKRSATEFPQRFKKRNLCLDTNTLDPAVKSAVEFVVSLPNYGGRELLRFRHLFKAEPTDRGFPDDDWKMFAIDNYIEDEHGKEIGPDEIPQLITGHSNAVLIPGSAKSHDIEYALNSNVPVPYGSISIAEDKIRLLAIFSRDMRELLSTQLIKEGPGSFQFSEGREKVQHITAVTGDQIRAHLMVFRRLYMKTEVACLTEAKAAFCELLVDHPLADFVKGRTDDYLEHLEQPPKNHPHSRSMHLGFSTKKLIDAVMYTKYLHQPKADRERHYQECLDQVGNDEVYLHGMFVCELFMLSFSMSNAGLMIASWFENWCKYHQVTPSVISSADHHGIGAGETKEQHRSRLFHEKVGQLARELWDKAGRPESGPVSFSAEAMNQLLRELNPPRD